MRLLRTLQRLLPAPDTRRGMEYLIGIPVVLLALGLWLPTPTDPSLWGRVGLVSRLLLVLGTIGLGLWLLRGATALAFGLASLVTLLLFHLPLSDYTKGLYNQASDLTVFMILLFGAVLFLLSRQDLLDRQARRSRTDGTTHAEQIDEERRLDHEVAVLCVLRHFLALVQRVSPSRLWRGLMILPLALVNFVSSATSALLFKSLWAPTRADFTTDPAGRTQAAGILCLCTTGVLVVTSSTWWLFFRGAVGVLWAPPWPPPLGVWVYGLLSYAHGYWLLTSQGDPALPPAEPEQQRLRRIYLTLLAGALFAVAAVFGILALQAPDAPSLAGCPAPATAVSAATVTAESRCDPLRLAAAKRVRARAEQDKADNDKERNRARIGVCTLLLALAIALLMAQGWLYSFHLPAASERWGPGGFWGLLLDGMRGVFVTVVLLVVILAFKDVVGTALTSVSSPCPETPSLPEQTLWVSLAVAVTLGTGMALGSSWGAFTLGFLVLQSVAFPPWHALTQVLILLATFCNQRSPRADNVLSLLGSEHSSSAAVRSVWAVTSFALPIRGRRFAVKAEWVQWGLVGLGIAASLVEDAVIS